MEELFPGLGKRPVQDGLLGPQDGLLALHLSRPDQTVLPLFCGLFPLLHGGRLLLLGLLGKPGGDGVGLRFSLGQNGFGFRLALRLELV